MVWEVKLAQPSLGGIAATSHHVVFGDRDLDDFQDVWRCVDAKNGERIWELAYLAIGKLDYGNSPRTTPLIDGRRVFLFGALGDLHCLELATGKTLWKRNVREDFQAKGELPWGYCGSPLLADGKLILNPGAAKASLVALDPASGALLWKTPGERPSYGSLIVAELGGKRQIVGHDGTSLGGWDVNDGRRLWRVKPHFPGDFNVPTPSVVGGKLLVATENNGTRLFRFRQGGIIDPTPVATNRRVKPDMSSLVVVGSRAFCVHKLLETVDLGEDLKLLSRIRHPSLADYGSILATDDRLLVTGKGKLLLFTVQDKPQLLSEVTTFREAVEPYSHPALAGKKLFVRGETSLKCFSLDQ